jgi:hypothetical protein
MQKKGHLLSKTKAEWLVFQKKEECAFLEEWVKEFE